MNAPEFRRDWTSIGKAAYVHDENRLREVERAISGLDWNEQGDFDTFLSTYGKDWIKEAGIAVKSLGLGMPLRIAFSTELAPHRFYGIETEMVNGVVRNYVMNYAGEIFVVAADFYPNAVGNAAPRSWTL